MSRSSAAKRRGREVKVASRASVRYLRGSAQKARLVVDEIRGLHVDEAMSFLRENRKRAAKSVLKLLVSAMANTENAKDAADIDPDELHVVRAWVDEGPVMKRIRPAPMGRAFPILKRQCHVTLELGTFGDRSR